ncbi:hypothetical protein BDD12DRAFT_802260 [Trichophaea hybrida]|nr:hypothetical protein BDD12DRAFT_802260 [Trichophaea hybrida]
MCVKGFHGVQCDQRDEGMQSIVSNYQASRKSGGPGTFISDIVEPSLGTRPHAHREQITPDIPTTARVTAGSYLWVWYCCRGRQGNTIYHHPGPFLVDTTPVCVEQTCDHIRCEFCETRQEWVPADICD